MDREPEQMDTGSSYAEAARRAAAEFEAELLRRLDSGGLDRKDYAIEITACSDAEGGEFAHRPDCVYIEQITSFQGNRGTGRRIMRAILQLADERGLTVVLEAASQKFDQRNPWWKTRLTAEEIASQAFRLTALPQEELEAWYSRLGFLPVHQGDILMSRPPAARDRVHSQDHSGPQTSR